jgi:uncharacterized protein (DUF2249 family)
MKKTAPRRRTLDVRASIAAGESPFDAIAGAMATLEAGQSLVLITPFLPSPLIEKLQAEGYAARPERRADGAWQTQFSLR